MRNGKGIRPIERDPAGTTLSRKIYLDDTREGSYLYRTIYKMETLQCILVSIETNAPIGTSPAAAVAQRTGVAARAAGEAAGAAAPFASARCWPMATFA